MKKLTFKESITLCAQHDLKLVKLDSEEIANVKNTIRQFVEWLLTKPDKNIISAVENVQLMYDKALKSLRTKENDIVIHNSLIIEKLKFRTAVTAQAEYNEQLRQFQQYEVDYIEAKVQQFTKWLANKSGLPEFAATHRIEDMYENDVIALKQCIFSEFIWSRGNDVGDVEIKIENPSPSERTDEIFFTESTDDLRMNAIAIKNLSEFNWDHWKAGNELAEKIEDELGQFVDKELTFSDRKELFKVKSRINALRFGTEKKKEVNGQIVKVLVNPRILTYKQYAPLFNLVNCLLDIEKRLVDPNLEVKVKEEKSDYIDALDNAVYSEELIFQQLEA